MDKSLLQLQKIDLTNLEEVKNQMLTSIKGDEQFLSSLQSANVSDEILNKNIGLIYEYQQSLVEVAQCLKAGKCIHANNYHARELVVNANQVFLTPISCPSFLKSQALVSRFMVSDFPPSFYEFSVDKLPKRRSFAPFVTQLMGLIKNTTSNIYAYGPSGIGKLSTAFPFIKHIAETSDNVTVGVFNFPAFVRTYGTNYFNQKETIDEYLRKLIKIDYLIIDEFGNEEMNKFVREGFTFPLINERINAKKHTIFLSEVSLDDLSRLYDYTQKDVRANQIINAIRSSISQDIELSGTKL